MSNDKWFPQWYFPEEYFPDGYFPQWYKQIPNTADRTLMAACDSVLGGLSAATITYIPATGASRSIEAQISYLGPEAMDGLRGGSRPQYDLLVKNNDTGGISAKEIDTGKDKAQIPLRMYRSVKTVRLVKIISQDKAMLRIRAW